MNKWSRKYEQCIKCWETKTKHHWLWLCWKCYSLKPSRKKQSKIATTKFNFKKKIFYRLRYKWPLSKKEIWNRYYIRHKEVVLLMKRASDYKRRWKDYMQMYINWKLRLLPFKTLEKPMSNNERYEQWKKDIKDFEKLKKHFEEN